MSTTLSKYLLGIFMLCTLLTIQSCKDDDKKEKVEADTDLAAATIIDETYYMKLKSADVESIFGYGTGDEVKQLIFTWVINKRKYALEVYGADAKGKALTQDYSLEILTVPSPEKNPKKLKRNPQEVTRGDIKKFLGLAVGTPTPIPPGSFKDMYFRASLDQDPKNPGMNLMFLFYSDDLTKLAAPLAGDGTSKPSPPAPPCDTGCDD